MLLLLPARLARYCPFPYRCPPGPDHLGDWVAQVLREYDPQLLVVDVFPRGILGELPSGPWQQALLTRWVDPRYYLDPGVLDALRRFDLILAGERLHPEILRALEGVRLEQIQPLTLHHPRKNLELPGRRVLALGSGPLEQQQRLHHRLLNLSGTHGFSLRFSSMAMGDDPLYPAARYFQGVELVIAAAGYQTYYEVVEAGVPALFLPQRRKTDDQARRAAGGLGPRPGGHVLIAHNPRELEESAVWLLENGRPGPRHRLEGAVQAAELLLELRR